MIRAGRFTVIPGDFMGVRVRAPQSAVVPWWLSGGVSAASCIAAYTPKGAASLAASYDNNAAPGNGLADGTYDAAPGVAPTFDAATGWYFALATQYLTTGITPAALTWSMICRITSYTTASNNAIAAASDPTGAGRFGLWAKGLSTAASYLNGAQQNVSPVLATTGGVLAVAYNQGYRDGVADGTTFTPAVLTTAAITIGKDSKFLSGNGLQGWIAAFAIYNTTLTPAQVAAITLAMQSL